MSRSRSGSQILSGPSTFGKSPFGATPIIGLTNNWLTVSVRYRSRQNASQYQPPSSFSFIHPSIGLNRGRELRASKMGVIMQIDFPSGKDGLRLHLPAGFEYRVLEPRAATALADPGSAIERSLDQPVGCAPLQELARGKKSAAISVCDI